jgi:hypothetical protein
MAILQYAEPRIKSHCGQFRVGEKEKVAAGEDSDLNEALQKLDPSLCFSPMLEIVRIDVERLLSTLALKLVE